MVVDVWARIRLCKQAKRVPDPCMSDSGPVKQEKEPGELFSVPTGFSLPVDKHPGQRESGSRDVAGPSTGPGYRNCL